MSIASFSNPNFPETRVVEINDVHVLECFYGGLKSTFPRSLRGCMTKTPKDMYSRNYDKNDMKSIENYMIALYIPTDSPVLQEESKSRQAQQINNNNNIGNLIKSQMKHSEGLNVRFTKDFYNSLPFIERIEMERYKGQDMYVVYFCILDVIAKLYDVDPKLVQEYEDAEILQRNIKRKQGNNTIYGYITKVCILENKQVSSGDTMIE